MYPTSEVLDIVKDHFIDPEITLLERANGKYKTPEEIINTSFTEYFKDPDLDITSYSRIGVVINDIDRPTPSYLILERLLEQFNRLEERISNVHIANGSHRSMEPEEVRKLLGNTSEKLLPKVHIHDGNDIDSHTSIGTTSRNTPVLIDSSLFHHDLLILINSVEPHYFAGYTGGRKSIVPGMSHHNTIEHNHSFAMDPGSSVLKLHGNPVHEDLVEAVDLFLEGRDHISFQMVQGPGRLLTGLKIGSLRTSFQEAVTLSSDMFTIGVNGHYDIIITIAQPPMDRTLYQAQKALENSRVALKEGGTMILLAGCEEGIGKSTFWDLLCSSDDPGEILDHIRKEYRLGYHKAARLLDLASRSRVLMVSTQKPETLEKGFIEGFLTLQDALSDIQETLQVDPRILIIPDGTVTVPNVME